MESSVAMVVAGFSHAYAKGILPWRGSFLDQPARLLRAMRLWEAAVAAYQDLPEMRRKASGA